MSTPRQLVLVVPLVLSAWFISSAEASPSPPPPNILLIIADDLGVDKVGVYADDADEDYRADVAYLPQTPVIDSLAAAGVRFTETWANPNCSPTRASIMTGLQAYDHGVGNPVTDYSPAKLSESETTLPEMLADAGYTSALFGKWHLGENDPPESWAEGEEWSDHQGTEFEHALSPNSHGFSTFRGSLVGTLDHYERWQVLSSTTSEDGVVTAVADLETDYATLVTTEDVLAWANDQTDPWFAVASYNAPHDPLDLPPTDCTYSYTAGGFVNDGAAGDLQALVECLDVQLGELLAGLDDLDDTLIVFVGDNGTYQDFAEAPFAVGGGKATVYEAGIRVPLIVADGASWQQAQSGFVPDLDWVQSPRIVADPGRDVDDLVSVADLFATLGDVAGADTSSGLDSVSLRPPLTKRPGDVRDVLYTEKFNPDFEGAAALRMGDHKLIVSVSGTDEDRCRDSYELYNLVDDRFETTDLATASPGVLARFQTALAAVVDQQGNGWLSVKDCE